MPTLNLKNVPVRLHRRLKQSAREHRRSLNNEAIFRLEQALGEERYDAETTLARAREVRIRLPGQTLSDPDLRRAKSEGRP